MPADDTYRVERTGRAWACLIAAGWAIGILLTIAGTGFVTAYLSDWAAFLAFPAWPLYLAILLPAVFVLVFRCSAIRILFGTKTHPKTPIPQGNSGRASGSGVKDPSGTIICCSGGGIKSAAFCLGALQMLQKSGVYSQARTVVGVSGGGYMATAFAARADHPPILTPEGTGVDGVRRRTNYLASSAAVRFDLLASVFWGFLVNAFIVGAVLFLLTWMVVGQARIIHLVDTTDPANWTLLSSAGVTLLLPAIPMLLAILWFLVRRLFFSSRSPLRTSLMTDESGFKNAWKLVSTNMPNTLFGIGFTLLLFYPGAPYLAVRFNNWFHQLPAWGPIVAGLTAFLTFVTTVRSVLKDTGDAERVKDDIGENVVGFYRQKIAPRIGIFVAVVGLYVMVICLTQYYLEHDLYWYITPLVAVILAGLAVVFGSANKTSLFPFYRDRLEYAYMPQRDPRTGPKLFSDLPHVGPELVLCATANVKDADLLPSGRNGTTFVFSRSGVGYTDEKLPGKPQPIPLGQFSIGPRKAGLDLATAMAISGAAVAPLAGREDKVVGANRVLLTLANVRMGVWARNPYWTAWQDWLAVATAEDSRAEQPTQVTAVSKTSASTSTKATRTRKAITLLQRAVLFIDDRLYRMPPIHIIREAFGTPSIHGCYIYLTDGGHYDNLGLVEALRRRPQELILIDGSGDPEDQFPAMGDAIASARIDQNVEVDFDPTPLQLKGRSYPDAAWTTATASYPAALGGGTCTIKYLKCLLPSGLSWDLESYKLRNESFPATSQKYEMYDEFDFEAFRQLGYLLMDRAEQGGWCPPGNKRMATRHSQRRGQGRR